MLPLAQLLTGFHCSESTLRFLFGDSSLRGLLRFPLAVKSAGMLFLQPLALGLFAWLRLDLLVSMVFRGVILALFGACHLFVFIH